MKLVTLLGGFVGFTMALVLGWMNGLKWESLVLRAAVSAYILGWLMRWWAGKLSEVLVEMQVKQRLLNEEAVSGMPNNSPEG